MSLYGSNRTSPFDRYTLSKCLYGSNRTDLNFILFYSSFRFLLDDPFILLFFLLLIDHIMYCQPYWRVECGSTVTGYTWGENQRRMEKSTWLRSDTKVATFGQAWHFLPLSFPPSLSPPPPPLSLSLSFSLSLSLSLSLIFSFLLSRSQASPASYRRPLQRCICCKNQ